MKAYIDDFNLIVLKLDVDEDFHDEFYLISQQIHKALSIENIITSHDGTYIHLTTDYIDPSYKYFISMRAKSGANTIPVYIGNITKLESFEQLYDATSYEFGALCNERQTTFRVYTPVAYHVALLLDKEEYVMTRHPKGFYEITIEGNHHSKPYNYRVQVNHQTYVTTDPYAKGLTVNSESGVVIDFNQLDLKPVSFVNHHNKDAIIYEAHIRDLTMHQNSGVKNKGKLAGIIEKNTKINQFSTGFDYIKSLGITHLELLPINDFARVDDINFTNRYNWGYDPEHFQTIDGSFSIHPDHPTERIETFSTVVRSYHEANIGIILDVVFNHIFIQKSSNFEMLVPGYYFRYNEDGQLSNGTGVGNDIKTERKMMRHFILDTLKYYTNTFGIDGYRFDLMGAIDIDTMKAIQDELLSINPHVLLLGEGWDLMTALAKNKKTIPENSASLPSIHFFNDYFRDLLKGNNFNLSETGYFNGKGHQKEQLQYLFRDNHVTLNKSINYVEVHDNHTLFDRLHFVNDLSYKHKIMIHQMATAFTIFAPGIPFIHAGQEFFRTKYGHGNTYNLGDMINQMDWNRRVHFDKEIQFFKQCVALRKKYPVFTATNNEDLKAIHVCQTDDAHFTVIYFDKQAEIIIMYNPTERQINAKIPRLGVYHLYLTNQNINEVNKENTISVHYPLQAYEMCVLIKARQY